MLLFGKRPQRFLISSAVKCAHFHGTRVGKPIPSHQVYQGTVFELVDHAVDFVLGKIALSVGTRAQSVQALVAYEIPREVVTEAIVNAVAHRDYTSEASVQVMLFADRLEIWNPGTLPPPLTLDKLRVPHESVPGNPLLARAMYLVKYIEQMGTGTLDMIARCVEAGLREPEFEATGSFVTRILRAAPAGQPVVFTDPDEVRRTRETNRTQPESRQESPGTRARTDRETSTEPTENRKANQWRAHPGVAPGTSPPDDSGPGGSGGSLRRRRPAPSGTLAVRRAPPARRPHERRSLGGAGVSPVGAAAAGSVGEREIRTQRRVVAFFRDVLGYAYLGDWRDRAGNANVETTLLIGWLRRQGHDDRIPGQVAANHPSSSVWRAPEAIALRIARIPAATSSRAVWPTSTLTQRTSPAAFSSSRSPAARTSLTRSSRCRPTGPARAGTRRG